MPEIAFFNKIVNVKSSGSKYFLLLACSTRNIVAIFRTVYFSTIERVLTVSTAYRVKPPTTKVAGILKRLCYHKRGSFREPDYLSTIQPKLRTQAARALSSAFRLISVEWVQVLLRAKGGTLASIAHLTVAGKDFRIART